MEDLSERMVQQLSFLQDRSAMLLKNYIEGTLKSVDGYNIQVDKQSMASTSSPESDEAPPFKTLQFALRSKVDNINQLKMEPTPLEASSNKHQGFSVRIALFQA